MYSVYVSAWRNDSVFKCRCRDWLAGLWLLYLCVITWTK
jgi:hypothetical protein